MTSLMTLVRSGGTKRRKQQLHFAQVGSIICQPFEHLNKKTCDTETGLSFISELIRHVNNQYPRPIVCRPKTHAIGNFPIFPSMLIVHPHVFMDHRNSTCLHSISITFLLSISCLTLFSEGSLLDMGFFLSATSPSV